MTAQSVNCLLGLVAIVIFLITTAQAQQSNTIATAQQCRPLQRICPFPYCDRRPTQAEKEAPGIGFSLEMAHAAAVVRHNDGSYQNVALIDDDLAYIQKMADLIATGYNRVYDNDTIRVLSNMVQRLRLAVEASQDDANFTVTAAALSSPEYGWVLYDEATAVLNQISIRNVMRDPGRDEGELDRWRELWTVSAAYAGRGMGLCADYLDVHACERQEACLQTQTVLRIDLSTNSLSGSIWWDATTYYVPMIAAMFVNTTLGTDTISASRATEQEYWKAVRRNIEDLLVSFLPYRVDYLILTGTSVTEPSFESALRKALRDVGSQIDNEYGRRIDQVLESYHHSVDEPLWVTARGAAEIAKRRQEGPFLCRYDDRSEDQKRPWNEIVEEWRAEGSLKKFKWGKDEDWLQVQP